MDRLGKGRMKLTQQNKIKLLNSGALDRPLLPKW